MQAFPAAVNECRNRQIGAQEERVLNLLRDEAAVLIGIKFGQRMSKRRYLCIGGPSAPHGIDPEEKSVPGMVHLLQRTLLKCDLPAVPRPDDASIDNEIATSALESCANGDSFSGLEKSLDQNTQAVRNGVRQLSGVSGGDGAASSLYTAPTAPLAPLHLS